MNKYMCSSCLIISHKILSSLFYLKQKNRNINLYSKTSLSDVYQKVRSQNMWLFNIIKDIFLLPTANVVLSNKIIEANCHKDGNKIRMSCVTTISLHCSRNLEQHSKIWKKWNERLKLLFFCIIFDIHRKLKRISRNCFRIYSGLQKSKRL